jgi:hypothetical protein
VIRAVDDLDTGTDLGDVGDERVPERPFETEDAVVVRREGEQGAQVARE